MPKMVILCILVFFSLSTNCSFLWSLYLSNAFFHSELHIYEPVPQYNTKLKSAWEEHRNKHGWTVFIHPFGLGAETRYVFHIYVFILILITVCPSSSPRPIIFPSNNSFYILLVKPNIFFSLQNSKVIRVRYQRTEYICNGKFRTYQ